MVFVYHYFQNAISTAFMVNVLHVHYVRQQRQSSTDHDTDWPFYSWIYALLTSITYCGPGLYIVAESRDFAEVG